MRLLVLGGSGFAGRAVVDEALARGWDVTTFNRGLRGPAADGVESLRGDRLSPSSLSAVLGGAREWDAVVDTWSGVPRAVRDSAGLLAGRVGTYAYVSSRSVYRPPVAPGADESAAVLRSSPSAEDGDYGEQKAGGELAAVGAFGDAALIARAGRPADPVHRRPRPRRLAGVVRRGRDGRRVQRGQPAGPRDDGVAAVLGGSGHRQGGHAALGRPAGGPGRRCGAVDRPAGVDPAGARVRELRPAHRRRLASVGCGPAPSSGGGDGRGHLGLAALDRRRAAATAGGPPRRRPRPGGRGRHPGCCDH
ncbi:NAD dependent epimerase/dehydratase family protein [Jiangella alkaliphila]|uniref:NAD dependent epimerase/dehydratase family protein n=1 Tax=Jiangella alkaliphila TaxID=419479 RepID=A0A1H2KTP8_9ACTN|nr:NAD dependent epimerase/dehydratase family protein [Jiangella alkaliphila]